MTDPIQAIITEAEKKVLAQLADAATRGDYGQIDAARKAAEDLRSVRARLAGREPGKDRHGTGDSRAGAVSSTAMKSRKERGRKRGGYPKFQIADSSLVKVGWSKKRGAEYTQRIPRDAFDAVVAGLRKVAENGGAPVSSEAIMERVADVTSDLPSYQTYGVMRFLRDQSAIRQVSRGEYAVPISIEELAVTAWNDLAGESRGQQ